MNLIKYLFILIALLFITGCENKAPTEKMTSTESCYQQLKLDSFYHPENSTHILILIDQTTPLSERLKTHLLEQLKPLYVEGNTISIGELSTFSKDYYTRIVATSIIDAPLTYEDEQEVARNKIKKLERCIKNKSEQANIQIPQQIKKTLSNSNSNIDQSELFKSFQDITNATLKQSPSNKKIILIASDMLEHSSITSFYKQNINPVQEIKKVKNADLLANFQGADIYVIGAGALSDTQSSKRSIQTMKNLKKFWELYFEASNGHLIEFGAPELLNPIDHN